ncbi:ComF family protein [Marinomonas transparens]|uniref:ComF family protein n=1 Tax=Marinomonas transparens TaxID=2795388 RepID=A0A934JTL2_9GAMM|nr:ComF family protein [Marinomonas transparens]MBJ7536817.1 ComF family protein [Marinomonas transparens]
MDWKILSTTKIEEVYYRLFLNRCYLCHARNESPICHYCSQGLAHNHHHCAKCKLPSISSHTICGHCQVKPPSYHSCHAPFRYEGIIKSLIHSIKFNRGNAYTRPLIQLLSEHLIQAYSDNCWPLQLIYVPSHPNRIKERGFCQTKTMASLLAKKLQHHLGSHDLNIPKQNPVEKLEHTQAQHTLSKKERLKTQKNLYRISGHIAKHVALFDDVMTTGSTIENCTKQLLKAGAERVDVWVIARTPDKTISQTND